MSQSVITTAFEQLKAEQAANGGILTLDEFVFANVPDLNITDPIDRGESWPALGQIVHRQDVSKTGTVNGNAVVYSVVLGAETGDFDFNWIGLINKASNTVAMIVHAPVQKKIKTASGQQGNVLTRSFMMEYNGASQITQITTPADTWQIDFTARLAGMDERIRKENIDTYGTASFYRDGFLVSREDGGYSVKKGVGYVAGLRAELLLDKEIAAAELPVKVWVDVCWKGLLTSVWGVETKVSVAEMLNDYSDNGQQHYVFAVAEIQADGTVVDLRGSELKTSQEIISDTATEMANKQPLNDTLTALAALVGEDGLFPYFSGPKEAALATLTPLAMTLLSRTGKNEILSDLGLQAAKLIALGADYTSLDSPDRSKSIAIFNGGDWGAFQGANRIALPVSSGGTGGTNQSSARTGLGLKSAATRDVGTGADQIPDMSSFSLTGDATAGAMRFPNGFKIVWGNFSLAAATGSSQTVTFYSAFSTACIAVIPAVDLAATQMIGSSAVTLTNAVLYKGNQDQAARTGKYIAFGY